MRKRHWFGSLFQWIEWVFFFFLSFFSFLFFAITWERNCKLPSSYSWPNLSSIIWGWTLGCSTIMLCAPRAYAFPGAPPVYSCCDPLPQGWKPTAHTDRMRLFISVFQISMWLEILLGMMKHQQDQHWDRKSIITCHWCCIFSFSLVDGLGKLCLCKICLCHIHGMFLLPCPGIID